MKFQTAFCLFLTVVFFRSSPVLSEEQLQDTSHVLTIVTIEDTLPFSFRLPDGTPSGLYVEFWELWSKTNNIPIRFVMASFEESLQLVRQKNTLHAGLFRNEQREQWADFSLPIHNVQTGVIYNRSINKDTKLRELSDIKIAAVSASFQESYMRDNYSDIELSTFQNFEDGYSQLLDNDVQAIIYELPQALAQLAKNGLSGVFVISNEIVTSNNVFGLVTKGQPELLAKVNAGIQNIPIHKIIALEKKWIPTLKPFFNNNSSLANLTLAERKWLQQLPSLRLGIESDWYPYEYLNDKGDYSGLTADYIDHIEKILSLTIEADKNYSWSESFAAIKNNKIDIIPAMVRTPEREKTMFFTDPYFSTHTVLVSRKNGFNAHSLASLKGRTIGIVFENSLSTFIATDYPEITIISVDSTTDGLKKLNERKFDAFINDISIVNHVINKEQLSDLIITGFSPYRLDVSMAVRTELEPLVGILNKVFLNMSEREKVAIDNNWLSIQISTGTELSTIIVWALPIISLLTLIILIFVRMNKKLKIEINGRIESEKEQVMLSAKLLQGHKMEALGEMAGGIAHDFNNLMGIIIGNSELLSMKFATNDMIQKINNNILNASTRATELVSQIMMFSRMSKAPLSTVNFSDVIDECVHLIKSTTPENIKISYERESGYDYMVKGNKTQINQVLINLCTNAIDAMAVNSGSITLTLSGSNIQVPSGLDAGNTYFSLKVRDSGCGIEKSIVENIFDPFFSTKEVGKGTGLGLSVVYNIINAHKGNVSVVNNEGSGVEFTILLPRTLEAPLNEKPEVSTERLGRGSILIAEDEEELRILYTLHLESSGYAVTTCKNGSEALALFKSNPEGYDLLLADHSMPIMTGTELIKAVLEINVDLPIILATGYADVGSMEKVVSKDAYKCLVKPVKRSVLLETVYRSIASNAT
jgi:signal transduction histidine kinase/ActR/RegA family two-component response regulator